MMVSIRSIYTCPSHSVVFAHDINCQCVDNITGLSRLQFTGFSIHPRSRNVSLNSTVTFTCEVEADLLNFLVEGEQVDVILQEKGFTELPTELVYNNGTSVKRRILSVVALQHNNNTNISCIGINFESANTYSNVAVLLIQGTVGYLLLT